MKKYLQVTIILAIFFAIVFWRRQSSSIPVTDQTVVDQNTASDQSASAPDTTAQTQNNGSSVNGPANSPSTSNSGMMGNSGMMQGSGKYKNGTYTGSTENASYGDVQVKVTISNGKISDVIFLQYPNDNNTSRRINSQAMPMLKSEALQAQSAQVDGVSGASYTSQAFESSLSNALQQAS